MVNDVTGVTGFFAVFGGIAEKPAAKSWSYNNPSKYVLKLKIVLHCYMVDNQRVTVLHLALPFVTVLHY